MFYLSGGQLLLHVLFLPPDEDDGEGGGRSGETEDQQPADVDPQAVAQLLLELGGVAGHAGWESQPGVTTVGRVQKFLLNRLVE